MKERLEKLASELGIRIDYLAETGSTNDDARSDAYTEGDIIVAERQTKGRGQRGNHWKSSVGDNLTFSLVLRPDFLPAQDQFMLSETVALSLSDMLVSYGVNTSIKWTNDIYIGGSKVAGILIENDICGANLSRSIAGIGLNVNQKTFDRSLPNPISMRLAMGREFDRGEVLKVFYKAFLKRYLLLISGDTERLEKDYLARLYLKDVPHTFRMPDGSPADGIIRSVRPSGELVVEHPGRIMKSYLFREIEY